MQKDNQYQNVNIKHKIIVFSIQFKVIVCNKIIEMVKMLLTMN